MKVHVRDVSSVIYNLKKQLGGSDTSGGSGRRIDSDASRVSVWFDNNKRIMEHDPSDS